jgi:serralysin
VFSGQTGALLNSFFAYAPAFAGGVRVAAGDVDGDGRADVITGSGPGATPHVKVFQAGTLAELASFLAYDGFMGGLFVGGGDLDNDGQAEVFTGADGGSNPHVKAFGIVPFAQRASFFAFEAGYAGGVTVGGLDRDGDGLTELLAGTGDVPGGRARLFGETTLALIDEVFTQGIGEVLVAGR